MWYLDNANEGYPTYPSLEAAEEASLRLGGEVLYSPEG